MMVIGKEIDVQDTYGQTLVKLGQFNKRIVVIEADLMKASGSFPFKKMFPERHFQVGIAEQNLVGVSAGFAAMGKISFTSTFANFLSQRSCDQVVNSVAFNKFNVKLCGTYAGLTSEKNGGTHISIEDIAIFRSMPNMRVIIPGDCVELASAMEAIVLYDGPVYLRIARGPMKTIFPPDYKFIFGKAVVMQDGSDASLISTGITTLEAIKAWKILKSKGIRIRHIHMPSIKPIDKEEILRAARETGAIITVENHSRIGGLGSAITEVVCDSYPVPVVRLGINDIFGETATLKWLLNKHKISDIHIVSSVEGILRKKCNFDN